MIRSNRNAIVNARNEFQTEAKRVLCVCSAGLLRSPTTANVLHKEYGYNTRACGLTESFALVPISEALIHWADEVVFVEQSLFNQLNEEEKELINLKAVKILNLPDFYDWNNEDLIKAIKEQYKET